MFALDYGDIKGKSVPPTLKPLDSVYCIRKGKMVIFNQQNGDAIFIKLFIFKALENLHCY